MPLPSQLAPPPPDVIDLAQGVAATQQWHSRCQNYENELSVPVDRGSAADSIPVDRVPATKMIDSFPMLVRKSPKQTIKGLLFASTFSNFRSTPDRELSILNETIVLGLTICNVEDQQNLVQYRCLEFFCLIFEFDWTGQIL